MKIWNDLGISKKIAVFTGSLLLIIAAIVVLFIMQSNTAEEDIDHNKKIDDLVAVMLKREIDHLKWVNSLQAFLFNDAVTELTVQTDPHKCGFGKWYYGEGHEEAIKVFPALEETLKKIEAPHSTLHNSAITIKEKVDGGDVAGAEKVFKDVTNQSLAEVQAQLAAASNLLEQEKATRMETLKHNMATSLYIVYAIAALALILAFLLDLIITRTISKPTRRLAEYADKVASGDLEASISIEGEDELGQLSGSIEQMVHNMDKMIIEAEKQAKEANAKSEQAMESRKKAEEAQKAASQASCESGAIARELSIIVSETQKVVEALTDEVGTASEGTETQLHYSTETAAAMGQMTAAVMEVAKSASSAADSAEEARKNAEQGAVIVADTINAIEEVNKNATEMAKSMNELGQQAGNISHVMNVITDIADQTNLLALNAAIEAARAGEAGRGFAVVADEVRKLAEKTMTATKEVEDVIKGIQNSATANISALESAMAVIDRSTELAKTAGESLSSIVAIAESNASQVHSIAVASEEQSASSEEVNKSTAQINSVATVNAELMHKADQEVATINDLTKQIVELVKRLEKIGETTCEPSW